MNSFFKSPAQHQAASQPKITLSHANPYYKKELELDRFVIHGDEYHRCCKVQKRVEAKKSTRKRPSPAWRHGELLRRLKDEKDVYYCYLCELEKKSQQLFIVNGNGRILNHLEDYHRIDRESGDRKPDAIPRNRPLSHSFANLCSSYDYDEFKRLLVRWIVYCFIAFRMLENAYFRELICFLNQSIGDLLPKAASTVRAMVKEEYDKQKELLVKDLSEAQSKIHISFDLWTSPNYYAIISVYSHFVDRRGRRSSRLLAFRRLHGSHGGENQASALLDVIDEYRLRRKVGYFMCDNAKSNDKAVSAVLKQLYPAIQQRQILARRLRCLGHITNLAARAMILGQNAGKALDRVNGQVRKGAFEAVEQFWRGRGAVGRLHNIIRYIRWNPQRREAFANCKEGGELSNFDGLNVSLYMSIFGLDHLSQPSFSRSYPFEWNTHIN